MTIRPPLIISAYENPTSVYEKIRNHSPYALMASLAGYANLMPGSPDPWFRAVWANDGHVIDEDFRDLFHSSHFVDAAASYFGGSIARPFGLLINVNGPMESVPKHIDTPAYRGLKRIDVPQWMLLSMGTSHLFERWMVRVAGILTWFYTGCGGEFEYWPDGPQGSSQTLTAPFGNIGFVYDNYAIYHGVRSIGNYQLFSKENTLTDRSTIAADESGAWRIETDGQITSRLDRDDVRVSLVWEALVFSNERDRARYDEHHDDLTMEKIVDVFQGDLRQRGLSVGDPSDPYNDDEWRTAVSTTYYSRTTD